ncbi:hypothetical protein NDU88_000557 [Pleurodeles waltl]|uniref:Uncharacterized protein n=1 Tax=Pleurodeles waltl TaxID=8319 RepID=A0AAV7MKV8_PLEWA|nr:hypothetical protein NDU88_000557 [Pleurodeles waltl]
MMLAGACCRVQAQDAEEPTGNGFRTVAVQSHGFRTVAGQDALVSAGEAVPACPRTVQSHGFRTVAGQDALVSAGEAVPACPRTVQSHGFRTVAGQDALVSAGGAPLHANGQHNPQGSVGPGCDLLHGLAP